MSVVGVQNVGAQLLDDAREAPCRGQVDLAAWGERD
jgi:hypothetical protein